VTKPLAEETIEAQISEIKRELHLRARVYPVRVKDGRMSNDEADRHMRRMEAVLRTLEAVQRKERLL
jgi:hypothetical protein